MLKIGWSEKSITPDKKIGLDGQFYERVSEGVETPITVTAWAVESDGEQLVICSGDLLGVGEKLLGKIRNFWMCCMPGSFRSSSPSVILTTLPQPKLFIARI